MSLKFVCLANSHRDGGHCVAGLKIKAEKITNQWVRPIPKDHTPHTIPEYMAKKIKLLSVVALDNLQPARTHRSRPEDYYFDKLIPTKNKFNVSDLAGLENNNAELVNNRHYDEEKIEGLRSSLVLVKGQIMSTESNTRKIELKVGDIDITKKYTGIQYDKTNIDSLENKDCYAVISVAEKLWQPDIPNPPPPLYCKLIAEVFPTKSTRPIWIR